MLNFKHFKKTSSDKDKTTLTHKDGHSITVAHKALSPHIRTQIEALPLNEGAPVSSQAPTKEQEIEQLQQPQSSSPAPSEPIPPTPVQEAPSVDPSLQNKRALYNSIVSAGNPMDAKNGSPDADQQVEQQFGPNGEAPKAFNAQVWNLAEQHYNSQQNQDVARNSIAVAKAMEDNKARVAAGLAPSPVPEGSGGGQPNQRQVASSTSNGPTKMPSAEAPLDITGKQAGQAAFNAGVQSELGGIYGEAQALGDLGNKQSAVLNNSIAAQQKLVNEHRQKMDENTTEYNNFVADVKNQHLDSQHYFASQSTAGKIGTAIGLILGGLGGSDAPSKFLDHQIDRDIEMQKAEMTKKQNLVTANMHRFNNINDATKMATAMQAGIVIDQLNKAASEAKSPLAAAAAAKKAGELYRDKVAPNIEAVSKSQVIMSQMAHGGGDPSLLVPILVPKEQQAEAFKEIKRAQDVRKVSSEIMKSFDEAAKDVRPLSGGRLKNVVPGTESAYLSKLEGLLMTTVQDQEGSVRQTAMDTVKKNYLPHMGNSDQEVAVRRDALRQYLQAKASAPTALSHGIDLDKFPSTNMNTIGGNSSNGVGFQPKTAKPRK